MEVLEAGYKTFRFADRHGKNVEDMMSRADFGQNPADFVISNYELSMMTVYWQVGASLAKDLTEPLKSIVNK